jgi:hypothetical protein
MDFSHFPKNRGYHYPAASSHFQVYGAVQYWALVCFAKAPNKYL